MMRKRLIPILMVIGLSIVLFLVQPPVVGHAYDTFNQACTASGGSGTGSATVCSSKNNTSANPLVGGNGILTRVADVLAIVAGVMVVIMIIIAGIKYITSNGDSSQTASAKNTIIYGLVGLVIIVVARTIVGFVVTKI